MDKDNGAGEGAREGLNVEGRGWEEQGKIMGEKWDNCN